MSNHIRELEAQVLRPADLIWPAVLADRLDGISKMLRAAPDSESRAVLWCAGEALAELLRVIWRAVR